jgi:diadenosine tetraphosphate (Ap4A) HIT family hydrolase
MSETNCPFCALPVERILRSAGEALVIRDAFPVSPGHTLVIPRRHVESFFELTAVERACMLELLGQAKAELDESCRPDGFNVGINDGAAAGQTVPHLHLHLIPRYVGDAPDPRGGVRWVLPAKAKYWNE